MLATLAIAAVAWCAAKRFLDIRVSLKTSSVADMVADARERTQGFVDEIRSRLMSREERKRAIAMRRARVIYDATVGAIFENATPDEQQTLLELFARYGQPQS